MPNKSKGPREYKPLDIPNSVVITPTKYHSEPSGFVAEISDFTELNYYLSYKFEPRTLFTIESPEGVARGGHLESRSTLVTVVSGLIYLCMVDMRPGENQGKVLEIFLGEGEKSEGTSLLSPEGVSVYYVPVYGPATTIIVGDRPYNKFDNLRTLDMTDPALGLKLLPKAIHHVPLKETVNTISLQDFIADISK